MELASVSFGAERKFTFKHRDREKQELIPRQLVSDERRNPNSPAPPLTLLLLE
jgi:hypothetical protein